MSPEHIVLAILITILAISFIAIAKIVFDHVYRQVLGGKSEARGNRVDMSDQLSREATHGRTSSEDKSVRFVV